jgi:glyoxylase-like metal-dependent hydrolase (beta-lactamase superfamily II)
MKKGISNISAETLRTWLDEDKPVFVLDVRPKDQRDEWKIPGSHYVDAYKRLKSGDMSVLDEVQIPKNVPVVTVCEAGRTSQIAASELKKQGIEVYSLEGGMKAWSLAWNKAELKDSRLKIIQIRRTGKGCLSYLVGSGNEAIVVDASVNPGVYTNLAKENNWQIKYVIDSHIHADHLSRSRELARITKSELFMPDQDRVNFSFNKFHNDDTLKFGSSYLKAIHTPGHTIESMAYLINDKYLFTGDTLFTNGVGRPDLKADADATRAKSKVLYQSLQKLLTLADDITVLPGHTSEPIEFDNKVVQTALGVLKKNVGMLKLDEGDFINALLQRIPATPPNYLSIVEKNLKGDFSDINPIDLEAGANRCAIS